MVYIEQDTQEPDIEEALQERLREKSHPRRSLLFGGRSVFWRWFMFGAIAAIIACAVLLSIAWSTISALLETA